MNVQLAAGNVIVQLPTVVACTLMVPVGVPTPGGDTGTTVAMVGRYVDSAAVYDSVLAHWRAAQLPRQRDYAITLANLGALRYELGDLDSAEALLREALDIDATLYGKSHPNTAVQKRMPSLLSTLASPGRLPARRQAIRARPKLARASS